MPKVLERVKQIPGLIDVTTDREQGGLQASVVIDRTAAARLGVRMTDIDNALNDAFSQRQISTIYSARNQYRVILEVTGKNQRDPNDLSQIYVPGRGGTQVPLSAVAHVERTIAPLVVNHQGQFPAVTITYNLKDGTPLQAATDAIQQAVAEMHMPEFDPHRVRRRRARLPPQHGRAAAVDPGGADRGLYRARRAVREPGASAHHHLDAALGRPRRAAGAAWCPAPS